MEVNKQQKMEGPCRFRDLLTSVSDNGVVFTQVPTPYSCSSLSYPHRSMVFFRNQTFVFVVVHSVRPFDYSVSDSTVVFTPSRKTSRLSTLSLSLGDPVPHTTQCMQGV
jgi:hypothetical protein